MVTKPTVFVLGAGASEPYGFPLGIELVDLIATRILSGLAPVEVRQFQALGHDLAPLKEFATALKAARPYSIDAFLETRGTFRDIGEATIAQWLLQAESDGGLQVARPGATGIATC
jgi:hypothetical protein